jgi:hypothetical protein
MWFKPFVNRKEPVRSNFLEAPSDAVLRFFGDRRVRASSCPPAAAGQLWKPNGVFSKCGKMCNQDPTRFDFRRGMDCIQWGLPDRGFA